MNKFKKFLIKEGFNQGGPTVFIVSFGDGRMGGSMERLIGIYATHDEAMDAAQEANDAAGLHPEVENDHYGAMLDEVEISEIAETLKGLGLVK